jgi:hypothetical protein
LFPFLLKTIKPPDFELGEELLKVLVGVGARVVVVVAFNNEDDYIKDVTRKEVGEKKKRVSTNLNYTNRILAKA